MKNRLLLSATIIAFFLASFSVNAQRLSKTQDDDNSNYTSVGNIRMTISNFGVYGNGLRNLTQSNHQPSCEYPSGSGIEHIYVGGLWIGGFKKESASGVAKTGPFVTTGAIDASSLSSGRNAGFEFTNAKGAGVTQKSTLTDSRYYKSDAISHQDYVMDFTDTNKTYLDGTVISDHDPLGIEVHHETYCWDFPFADFFVIMNYTIKNVNKTQYLDSVYVGLWTDAVVRNTKITTSTNTAFFSHGGDGFADTLQMAYEYDVDGDAGYTDSYIGVQFLGSTPVASLDATGVVPATNFNSWTHNGSDANFFTPTDEVARYKKMQGYFGGSNRYNNGINPADLKVASNRSILLTHGYYTNIAPGDSINVVFAIVCAKKYGTDLASLDSWEQRQTLYSNADWALRAYYGNDRNRDGVISSYVDPTSGKTINEDIYSDGKIHRYILPAPPTSPKVHVVNESNKATIYWDKRAESSIDPISGLADFAGYRVYRTNAGYDLNLDQSNLSSLVMLTQVDSAGSTGYNTGFKSVELSSPMAFEGDTTKYWYKYEVSNLLNGWQYLFSVTAFDKGDVENSLDPLESSKMSNMARVVPGTVVQEKTGGKIGVYPNPYYGSALWDGNSERLRKIYFYNLPEECDVTIYTLAGDIVKKFHHDKTSNGADIRWFTTYADGTQKFAGGEHAWDLITDRDQAIATGLYLFTVKSAKDGSIQTGKFLIVK
jgi:hypothetical protein